MIANTDVSEGFDIIHFGPGSANTRNSWMTKSFWLKWKQLCTKTNGWDSIHYTDILV